MRTAVLAWALTGLGGARFAHAAAVTTLTFAPDGSALVSNGERRIEIRSLQDGSVQRRVECGIAKVTALAFSPQGRFLAVGGGEPGVRGEAWLLSWPEGTVLHRLDHHADLVTGLAFDASGRWLGVASADHTARIWAIDGGGVPALSLALSGHAGPVTAIGFSPSGQSIVTAGADRALKVWASSGGRLIRSFSHHTEAIHALAFQPRVAEDVAPVVCVSGGDDRTVRVWQPEIGRMVRIVRRHEAAVFALAWSADGRQIFSAGKEGVIRRIDGASDTIEATWKAHDDWIYALALSSDGKMLASGDWTGRVRVHNLGSKDGQAPAQGLP